MQKDKGMVAKGWGEGEMSRRSTENFYSSENTLYDTISVDIYHHIFVQTHRRYNIDSEP